MRIRNDIFLSMIPWFCLIPKQIAASEELPAVWLLQVLD